MYVKKWYLGCTVLKPPQSYKTCVLWLVDIEKKQNWNFVIFWKWSKLHVLILFEAFLCSILVTVATVVVRFQPLWNCGFICVTSKFLTREDLYTCIQDADVVKVIYLLVSVVIMDNSLKEKCLQIGTTLFKRKQKLWAGVFQRDKQIHGEW